MHNLGTVEPAWTEELRYGYAGDADRARDDSDFTVWRGVWNTFHHSRRV